MNKWFECVDEQNMKQTKCLLDCKDCKKYLVLTIINNNNPKIKTKIYVLKTKKYERMTKKYIHTLLDEYIMYYGGK